MFHCFTITLIIVIIKLLFKGNGFLKFLPLKEITFDDLKQNHFLERVNLLIASYNEIFKAETLNQLIMQDSHFISLVIC